ncbi:MAG: bifunctional histidinol-phosphatase/imidazoleglycerol-phosphate dehydratase HisB [Gammaproteobacteria bacterium]|jgi:imidazoleglycerol-phosphate dehydratase/histidinol-phosphatase
MSKIKYLFIDRDGTIIDEPEDYQIDSLEKLNLEPGVIPALLQLQQAGFKLIMVSNQDGLGTESFPQAHFDAPHQMLMNILNSQGVHFADTKICPHKPDENCQCRKPNLGLVLDYLKSNTIDFKHSYVIGDRKTDHELADNMGIQYIPYNKTNTWSHIARSLLSQDRSAHIVRKTNETNINVHVNLDNPSPILVKTGIGFFDHMLEQLAKHSGIGMTLEVLGDLHIDEHHTVEDTAIALGQAIREALGDKLGISRYGFLLPMDEALTEVALDLSGRSFFVFEGNFPRDNVGELSTEMIPHFFRSLAEGMHATLHIKTTGENTHHMIESMFKGVGRALKQAVHKQGHDLPSTKGSL